MQVIKAGGVWQLMVFNALYFNLFGVKPQKKVQKGIFLCRPLPYIKYTKKHEKENKKIGIPW